MSSARFLQTVVGGYRLVERLGAGGMGEVYRGVHVRRGDVAAVKVLSNPDHSTTFVERFRNEARLQAGLRHDHIARLYDLVELGDRPCIVMEYVDGETLDERLRKRGPFSVRDALASFRSIVDAVAYLHRNGIIHRDLKSSNVKIDTAGRVKLLDFGIARILHERRMTAAGIVVGTPECLAPEQVRGHAATEASDVWALGVLLYEMVTGQMPFKAEHLIDLYSRIDRAEYVSPTRIRPSLPAAVEEVIACCLRREPAERYASATALLGALDSLRSRERAAPAVPSTPKLPWEGPRLAVSRFADAFRGQVRALASSAASLRPFRRVSLSGWTARRLALALGLALLLLAPAVLWRDTAPSIPAADESTVFIAGEATLGDSPSHRIRIEEADAAGAVEVWIDGEKRGSTPLFLEAPVGAKFRIELRREGWKTRALDFTMPASRSTFPVSLDPLR